MTTKPYQRKKKVLVTAALPYSNGRLHVGHIAGAYLPADIFVRYLRMRGTDVRFISGSDDHGVAIMMSAEKEGKTPAELAAWYGDRQAEDFKGLGIDFDIYGSTSRTKNHYPTSQDFFTSMYAKGYFEKESSRQFYDESNGVFLPDRYVKGTCGFCGTSDQNGDQCENCGKMLDVDSLRDAVSAMSGTPASVRDTVHWFLDLSNVEKAVGEWLDGAVVRDQTRNFVRGLLSTGLVKRSMTRDISWGIPVPLDEPDAKNKVMYVWFDAPIGYISNTKELCETRDGSAERYADWWKSDDCEIFHFIGEDNSVFHCVIWIAMLHAEGSFKLPTGVIVNQFLNIQFPGQEEAKMSKSRGTALWIGDFLEAGGDRDGLRYYLTSIAPEKARTVYRPEEYAHRYNSELANVVGNFVHRVLSFTRKYAGETVPEILAAKVTTRDDEFDAARLVAFEEVTALMEQFSFRGALERIMNFARECNRYIDDKAPWVSRKTDMDATTVTLVYALRGIKLLAVVFQPILPDTAVKMQQMLGMSGVAAEWDEATVVVPTGTVLAEPVILFQKIEDEKI